MEIQPIAAGGGSNVEDEETLYKDVVVPSWKKQMTWRSIITSSISSFVFNIIVCKLNLTTGIIPSLNVAAGLLGYAFVKFYTSVIDKYGLLKQLVGTEISQLEVVEAKAGRLEAEKEELAACI